MIMDLETNASFSKEIQAGKTVERKSPFDRGRIGEDQRERARRSSS